MFTYIFLGIGILLAILFLIIRDKKSSVFCVCFKTIASISFIITGLVACLCNKNIATNNNALVAVLMITGLICGLFGDFALDLKVYFKNLNYLGAKQDSNMTLYFGMGAFAVGHIVYFAATYMYNPINPMYILYSIIGGLIISLIVVIGGGIITKLNYGKFFVPSIIYMTILSSFTVLSIFYVIKGVTVLSILRLLGTVFFAISDIILSITYFSEKQLYSLHTFKNPENKFYIVSNHAFYYAAQFMLAMTLLFL